MGSIHQVQGLGVLLHGSTPVLAWRKDFPQLGESSIEAQFQIFFHNIKVASRDKHMRKHNVCTFTNFRNTSLMPQDPHPNPSYLELLYTLARAFLATTVHDI